VRGARADHNPSLSQARIPALIAAAGADESLRTQYRYGRAIAGVGRVRSKDRITVLNQHSHPTPSNPAIVPPSTASRSAEDSSSQCTRMKSMFCL